MMRNILVLLVLFPLASTKRCCFPKRFEVRTDVLTIKAEKWAQDEPLLTSYEVQMYVDTKGKRVRQDMVLNGQNRTVLIFYKTRTSYVIEGNSCRKGYVPEKPFRRTCVPRYAVVTDRYRLGYKPSINVVDYSFAQSGVNLTLSFTTNCSPVGGKFVGKFNDTESAVIFILEDFTPKIKDLCVFEVPDICKHSTENLSSETDELLFGHF